MIDNKALDIEIDQGSGFCFGVVNAIKHAEKELSNEPQLRCLGDIVHNNQEVKRLEIKGLHTINYGDFDGMRGGKVLFRAHGEAPEVYARAKANGVEIVDATCPVVLALQRKIKKKYEAHLKDRAQIVIFGKHGHAEVIGLVGQTNGEAIVIQKMEEAEQLDFSRPIILFSQTTMPIDRYEGLIGYIRQNLASGVWFEHHDTICRQVANRMPNIASFAASKDWVFFVAGKKSSNGKVLFEKCKQANSHTQFISSEEEITEPLPSWVKTVGVCGATSTPKWLMEAVADKVKLLGKER